ncbi:uncharacterized protein LOC111120118 isoform X8 [Crassostrea virginica]
MHGSVRLMSTSNRILTYVVLWSLVNSVCVFSQVLNENFGNQLDLYEKNLTWLTCPEGWSKIGSTCVLVLAELATFTQAESLCQSYGGGLLRIEGFNQNQRYGALIENVQNQQKDQFLSLGDWNGNSFWIGMYRDGDGQYHWVDGQVTNVGQGFWALDQPLGFQQGHKQCSSIDVKSVSDFGKYRWSLRPCEEKLPIVCQTVTCAVQQYRCQGESKCISADWLCDGIADCLDQSDERNCSGYCGNTYQGNQGTFQSPYYPHRYPSLSSCQWDIHTPLGTRVYLKFDDFNLENDYDVVSIYDGRSTLDPLVGNFSGDSLPTIPLSSSNNLLVQFHSDQDNQSTGFNVTWFAVVIPDCGGSLNATSQNQWLAFPAYNSLYVHNLICDWILSAPQDSISLQFEDVSLGAGDWVEVRDGDSENGVLFGRYTGDTLPPVIVSTGHHLFVRFTSDQKSDGRGFNVSFKAGCNDIIINKEAAIISSPGYRLGPSFTYPPNLQCSWQINSPTDRELAIVFDDNFDTEVDFDVLTIINGSSLEEAGALSQRFSGTKTPPVLRSLRGHFSISFTSDDLVSRPGWRATISPDCPVLSNLSDSMHISSRGQEYGTVVKFTCDTGYLLEGATTLICDINGTWSDSPPVCKKISCGSPSIPENGGIVSSNSSYYTGLVQYRCDVGYHSHDELISRCQRNGKWSSVPKCERIRCPKIGNLQNGSFINDFDNTFGQKVSFRCNGNFRLVNASEIICQEDGQWSALKPHCAPPLCPYLPIANGNTSVLHPEGGTWVQVHCKPGFQLLGSQNVWCGLDGTYQSSIPTCTDVNECEDKDLCHPHMCQNMMGSYKCRCSHGYQKLNETSNQCIDVDECERPNTCDHHCINTEGGYVCECNSSYKLYQGREAIIIDQRVIIPNKTCIVTCPAFNVSNGGRIFANTTKLSDETYIYPTSLFIYCPYGILPLWNSTTVFCQANGIWSHNIDRCTDQVCEALVPPINGSVYYDNQVLQLGTIATFNCSEGYILSGTPQKQCVSNGRSTFWKSGLSNSNLTFCLPRMCVEPTAPFNGYVNFTGRSVGSPATYSCKCGYELIGSRVRYCQGNGVWSGNGTICVDMDCPAPIPPSNGAVYSSTRMNYFGSQVSYTCQKGYTLTGSRQSTCSLPEQTTPPQLLRLLKVKFRGDNNINEHCASQYRAVLAAKFNESIHSLPGCSSVEMYVLDSSEGNVSGSEIIIGTSITLSGSPSAMCQCSEDIVQRTPSSIDWEITVNSCPTLNNKNPSTPQDKFEERVQDWKCPADFVLQGGAMDCAYNETPICRKVTVEADKTPFFVNEVFFKFQTYNLTKLCTEKLSEKFQHSVDQASGAITKLLRRLPLCLHITDAELINTKSRFSHDPMSTRNQSYQFDLRLGNETKVPTPNELLLSVPFILRTRKFPLDDMESCINSSIKSLLEVGFESNISNLVRDIPSNICHKIELIDSRYTMDIQCPKPFGYNYNAKRCYTGPLPFMPVRLYLIQVTLSLASRGGTQCNISYQRSIRRHLETQNVNLLKNGLYDMCLMYNVVVKINTRMSNLTKVEDELRGNVGIVLMATSENPNYNGCVGGELHKYIFLTDIVPGGQIIPTDSPGECGNLTWEKNEIKGMADTCLEGYFKHDLLHRCIEEKSAELRANYTPNITWRSIPNHECLYSLALQMESYMKATINDTTTSDECSWMYRTVKSRLDLVNHSVLLELSILPFQWNQNAAKACLKLLVDNNQRVYDRFYQNLSTSCQVQDYLNPSVAYDFRCIKPNFKWNASTSSCVKVVKRKKRSRPSQTNLIKRRSVWEDDGPKIGRMARKKRNVAQNASKEVVASWLPMTPLCQDQQPPVFDFCPGVLNISMGRQGPLPFNFSLPRATDNSGVPPTLSYSPADIFRQPYPLKNETQIVIIATDQSTNVNNCTIKLNRVDDIPPDMICPDSVVVEQYSTKSNHTNISIANRASASDYSGIQNISYQILNNNGYSLPVRHFINVTAKATDGKGNTGSCHFLYEAKRADLNANGNVALNFSYSMGNQRASCKNTTFNLISNDVLSIANNSCIKTAEIYLGYQFRISALEVEQSFMYTVQVLLKRSKNGRIVEKDVLMMNLHVIQLNVHKEKFHQCMDNFTQEMIRKYQSGSYPTDPNCGGVNISLTATKSAILCPTDSVLNESSLICSQCDLGYYANQSSHSCQRCPSLDSGVIIPGDCIPCDSNLNTISCLNQCQPGEYSENGLQPCIKCPRGQYTPNTGARVCQRCQDGNYTEKTGAVSSTQCQAKCPVGQYSDTGLQPCLSCPWNHYADAEMSTSCTPCPQGQVTNTTGKTSPTDCQAIDFCMNGPCQNGGTCQRTLSVNWYSCHCPSGYYGYHCEHRYSVCESDPCLNGGTCTEQNNKPVCHCPTGYTGDFCEVPMSPCSCVHGRCRASSDGYYCSCFKGYMGDNCSQDIDECLPNPCLHGGRCLNQIGQYQCDCSETGYNGVNCSNPETETSQTVCFNEGIYVTASRSCSCPPGYSGAQCQNLVDECHYNFCGDNGYCIDEIMNFTCVCKPGFTGRFCTENLNECLANPCRNGARCIPGNNNFSCVCPPGFEGKQCEINRDECSPFPCNLTTAIDCKDGINDYTCVCREGWTGKWCEIRNHSCPYQCQNGGTCNGSALRCDCRAGFTGPYCEVELDECAGQPCLNGGTCTDLINAFNCTCPQGYTSPTCSVNVNECSSNPCKNGGTCLDLVNGFVCSCTGGFTGSDCSEEVSRCSSLPCENGAVCLDSSTSHGYLCDCPYGYKGQNCSEIVRCDSSPCRNGGSCTQEENDFNCSCTPGFKGKTCDIPLDPCLLRNVCQNGATCVNGTCLCTQYFTGFDCGKVKSSNFDLFFRGLNGSSSSAWITVEQEMSVCLWIRSFNTGQNKVMLTLAVNNTQTGKFLEIKEESYSVTYPQLTWYNTLNMDSGLWNHFCFTWTQKNSRSWSLYLNGSKIKSDDDMALPNRVMILLGQPLTPEPGQAQFYGEVSQVQVFPEQLQENDISTLSKACSPATKKSSNSYLELLANIRGDVTVIRPSVCGGQRCPTGYKGHDCSVKVDKNPPTVHGCPSDFRVVSSNRLNLVNWTEPIFSDDVGVVSVNQTHRSGEVLTYGEYAIQYWAFDAANNTAHCSFRVAVTPFDCEIPEVPEGVNHSCQTARDRSYCSLSCMNPGTHAFSESVPQFYKCGLSGLWDPPRGENFTFPACAAFSPPAAGVTGTVSFAGPTCTDNLKDRLVQIFKQTMAKWNQEFGLCPDQICNLQVRIHCSGDITDSLGRRRKRQAPDTSYLVRFNFPVNKTSLETTSLQPLDSIKTYVKKGEFNTDGFVAKNDSVTVTTQCNCLDGQVLMNTGTTEHCVNCALGSFHNKSESTCDLCHVGYYNDQEGKTACIPCPPGQTTQDPGAQQISKCYTICPAGQYAEDVTNVCKNCPLGYYQELSGSRMCHSCPNGQVTLQEGATSLEQCQAGCPKGQELSVRGTCVPCQPGFYKDQTTLASCQPCPYGTTTEAGGSTSLDKCNIAVCAAGSYRSDNQCFLCPLGQYQPRRGQTQCLQCGPGQTTVLEGSRRAADCVEGNVDECQTNVAQCGPNTICIDTPKSYECKCAEGSTLQKNGNCTVERQKEDIPQDNKTWIIVGCTVGAGVVILTVVIIILIYRCRKNEKEDCLQHVGALYRRDQVVVMPGGTAPRFYNQTFVSSRSSSLSLAGSDLELSPVMSPFRWNQSYLPEAEADLLPSFWPDEPLNISDSSENGSTEGAQSSSSGFDVNSDSYF